MRGGEALGQFLADPHHFGLIESTFPIEAGLKRLARQVLHGDERYAVVFANLADSDAAFPHWVAIRSQASL